MLGPLDYLIWMVSFALEAYVVVCSIIRKDFSRYLTLNLYMIVLALTTVVHFVVFTKYGFSSVQYRYVYYYSDCILTVVMYFAIMHLYQHVFREMKVGRYLRGATALLLGVTAWFSYIVVHHNTDNMTSRLVVELGQNLYFVGVVLTYVLWGAVMKLHETRLRLIQLVLSLGVYFSAYAALYALRNLFPDVAFFRALVPVVGTWLPLAWAYTFTKVPESARLATARLVAGAGAR